MTDWLKANKMYLFVGVLIIAALAIYYFMPAKPENAEPADSGWEEDAAEPLKEEQGQETAAAPVEPEMIMVDVKGAVVNPGVYEAKPGDRVIDIIHLAGGLLENADKNQINFAMKVTDEMVLYLPQLGEQTIENNSETPAIGAAAALGSSDEGKVNLNTASEEELQTITGIGPSKAAAIIEYRETNGHFQEVEQLMEISGIGEKTFEKLKEEVSVK
ncbi:helix-hairpin-helix domain-containing protein [Bacillus benzoevorans]|uniref:Competence protein ComEA n=1 Tax=Bacillus benzoevorans TaxID=1456 RepID=A0A7X0HSF0_9BACI|nr:helix-hairpin-helix domain-containing protein [Bacillus benzoevorans]MBB6445958.1 competence protein ComEA [Bacillus benzoevorans]